MAEYCITVSECILLKNFLSFFFRGRDLDGNNIGIAYIGTMCNRGSSIGLTQDGGRGIDSVGSTAAHELGHIFNMNHDGKFKST